MAITAIKRRLQKEMMEKKDQSSYPSEEMELVPASKSKVFGETEIEDRLQRLEKSGDAWLTIMIPILENMNRTLTELQRNGHEPARLGQYLAGQAEAVRATWSQLSTIPSVDSPTVDEKDGSGTTRPQSLPVEMAEKKEEEQHTNISRTRSVDQLRRCYEGDVESTARS